MPSPIEPDSSRFTKSKRNQGTQKAGLSILLRDSRFRKVDLQTRKAIISHVSLDREGSRFGPQSFDLIMAPESIPEITPATVLSHMTDLRLVEMKATKQPIQDASLNKFFFGLTKREAELAEHLGHQFLFAFVVLNSNNVFGRPFARLLTLTELRERTNPWRTQFQVNFRSDLPPVGHVADSSMILLLDQPPG